MIKAFTAFLDAPKNLVFKESQLNFDGFNNNLFLGRTIISAISPGTELSAWLGLPHLREGVTYPRLVGYCNIGEVIETGNNCKNVSKGDLVLTHSSHRSHFVQSEDEFFVVLPKNVDPKKFVITYLFHLGYSTILSANEPLGADVSIIGLGTLGIATVQMSKLAGWNITAISSQKNLKNIREKFPKVIFKSRTEEQDFNQSKIVIVTTNSWSDWDLALKLAGYRGKIIVLGFPGRGYENIPFNPLRSNDFYVKQLKIISAGTCPEEMDKRGFNFYNEKDNIKRIIKWITEDTIDISIIKTITKPAEELGKLYESLASSERDVNTYLLHWDSQEKFNYDA